MKLNIKPRTISKKSEIKEMRREGGIPAIIYHKDKEGEMITVNKTEFQAALRAIKSGHLPTTIFEMNDGKGKARRVIVKDIQYKPTNYDIIHLDFEELHDDVPVKVKVPVEITGEADSVGVKLGGVVRIVIRHVPVEVMPAHFPTAFMVDVTQMNLGETIRVEQLKIPNTMKPLVRVQEVAVSMVKR